MENPLLINIVLVISIILLAVAGSYVVFYLIELYVRLTMQQKPPEQDIDRETAIEPEIENTQKRKFATDEKDIWL